MLFNSFSYLFFLGIAVSIIWLCPQKKRVYLMGMASVLFYSMWRWEFVFLVIFSAIVDFWAAGRIARSNNGLSRKILLGLSLGINLGLLVFFKYTYFLCDNLSLLPGLWGGSPSWDGWKTFHIVLPLGISFYTFQTISYTIDAYRGSGKTTDDFLVFLTYVSFWPQLVAGPILRASEMIPQLEKPGSISLSDAASGIQRVVIGLFKKVVIADNLAGIVDASFSRYFTHFTAIDVWVVAILFGFQIYLDFSGYSDIAIGSARLAGVRIPENFNWPYMALSPREFWQRWHISLSSWIRDYLYLPLTGQQFKARSSGGLGMAVSDETSRRTWALFLTWLMMGLWHGAAWKFAVWGVHHACFVYIFRRLPILQALPERRPILAWLITFLVCMAGWIPFRAESFDQMLAMYAKILNPFLYDLSHRAVYGPHYFRAFLLTVAFIGIHRISRWDFERRFGSYLPEGGRLVVIAIMSAAILIYLKPVEQFIYFQF
jgi:alginate O-acetyltransferase complex protein AlgI